MIPLLIFASSILAAAIGGEASQSRYGGDGRQNKRRGGRGGKKNRNGGDQQEGSDGGGSGPTDEVDPLGRALDRIDLEFSISDVGDEVSDDMFLESFGAFPGPPTGSQILQSAGLAQPGSWTERNVLQAGARDAWSRRVSGNASEADYAILRAARPGITSSASGPISPAWTKAPWPGSAGMSTAESESFTEGQSIEDAVLAEMGL